MKGRAPKRGEASLLCLLGALCMACAGGGEQGREQGGPPLQGYQAPAQPPADAALPHLRFADLSERAGLDFAHENGAFGEKWMPETMGSGCALFDLEGDGDPDLLLVNGNWWPGREEAGESPAPALYRNQGDFAFADITTAAGLDISLYGMGAAAGDYDGDGDPDLYLTAVGDNVLLRNQGGRFADVAERAGVAGSRWGGGHPEWSTGAAWVDVDRDGWIDLFVANYVHWSPEADLFTTIDGVHKSYATPQQYDGSTCRLYRNQGDGTFAEQTRQAGLFNPQGKSLGVAVTDIDDDGWPDLVVANDTQPNFLYHNQGDGTFAEIGLAAGIAYDEAGRARAGMGVDVVAPDNDRALAIAFGNFSREPVSLYRQARARVFVDEAGRRGLAQPTLATLTFGLLFADIDLDGFQDLLLANGHIEPEVQKVQKEVAYAQAPQLFWNDRQHGFREAGGAAGAPFSTPRVGRGLAAGDLDGDGDVDLVLTTNGGPAHLLRNESRTGRAVRVRLRGAGSNGEALGAVVTATAGDLEQRAMVRTGSSYLSQSETTLTFGLGDRERIDRLVVRWPDGRGEVVEGLEAGATYAIEEGRGVVGRRAFERAD